MDAAVEEAFAKLKLLKVADFYKKPVLTQEELDRIQLICDRYLVALPDERDRIHSMVKPEISFLFFMYAKDMAVKAVRDQEKETIFKGLVALAVENQVFDWRDSMTVLVLLHHSAVKIGANALGLFQRVAAISSPRTSDGFLQFSARTPDKLDIGKFGFKEGTDSEGNFAYVPK